MEFRVVVNMDNVAFDDENELPRIVEKIARQLREGGVIVGHAPIIDINGNRVGEWTIELKEAQ